MSNVDEDYINSLNIGDLRIEAKYALEVKYGLLNALRDLPEFPEPFVLIHLAQAAKYPDDFNLGKELQRTHGLNVIPPKHECEGGAGLWRRIRNGLIELSALKIKQDELVEQYEELSCLVDKMIYGKE